MYIYIHIDIYIYIHQNLIHVGAFLFLTPPTPSALSSVAGKTYGVVKEFASNVTASWQEGGEGVPVCRYCLYQSCHCAPLWVPRDK